MKKEGERKGKKKGVQIGRIKRGREGERKQGVRKG